jgi:hypothetical protein
MRFELRRHWWLAVCALLLVYLATRLAVAGFSGGFSRHSYREQLVTYLNGAREHDVSKMRRVMCASERALFNSNEEWLKAIADNERQLGGPILAYDMLRGAPTEASVYLKTARRKQVLVRLPIADEGGRRLVCPQGSDLLGTIA